MKSPAQIRIWIFTRADMKMAGDAVFSALNEDQQLAPEQIGLFEPYEIDLASVAARELWQNEARQDVGLLCGERRRPFRIGLTVSFGLTPQRPFHSLYWTADKRVLKADRAANRIEKLFRQFVVAFDAYWGAAFCSEEFEQQNVLHDYRHPDGSIEPYKIVGVDLTKALPGLYWLNFFGSVLSDFIGHNTIKSVIPSAESVGNGVFLRLASSPTKMLYESANEQKERIRSALGDNLFYDRHQSERPTRAPILPTPSSPMPPPLPQSIPSIKEPTAFINSAESLANELRQRHRVDIDTVATLRILEKELDALGLHAPSQKSLEEYAAVLGQLVIELAGGHWVAEKEPYIVTLSGTRVYPISQILKRAVDPDALLADWLKEATTL